MKGLRSLRRDSLQLRIVLAVGLVVTVLWLAAASLTGRLLDNQMNQVFDRDLRNTAMRILPLVLREYTYHGRGYFLSDDDGHESESEHGRPRGAREDDHPQGSATDGARPTGSTQSDTGRDESDRREGEFRVPTAGDLAATGRSLNGLNARLQTGDEYFSYVVRDDEGAALLLSPGADPAVFPRLSEPGYATSDTHRLFYATVEDGEMSITVAEPLSHRRAVARDMLIGLSLPLLLVIPISLSAILFVVRRGLRPLVVLRRELARRGPRNLGPLSDAGLPSEISPIAQGINQLLERLQEAFEAERSFAANAAHELRTPVAGAIAQAQRLQAETADPQASARAREIETTLKRLNGLSVKLMQLARAEGSRLRTGTAQDMRPVLRIVAEDFRHAGERGRIEMTLPEAPVLSDLDPDAFGILARNLIENALRHGTADQPVVVALSPDGVLSVANDCAPIAAGELARLTQRFARSDTAGEGVGLGLAIVRTIAERGEGDLQMLSPSPGAARGMTLRFVLPQAG
jgi:two-component system, OmpR family, sensor kinase